MCPTGFLLKVFSIQEMADRSFGLRDYAQTLDYLYQGLALQERIVGRDHPLHVRTNDFLLDLAKLHGEGYFTPIRILPGREQEFHELAQRVWELWLRCPDSSQSAIVLQSENCPWVTVEDVRKIKRWILEQRGEDSRVNVVHRHSPPAPSSNHRPESTPLDGDAGTTNSARSGPDGNNITRQGTQDVRTSDTLVREGSVTPTQPSRRASAPAATAAGFERAYEVDDAPVEGTNFSQHSPGYILSGVTAFILKENRKYERKRSKTPPKAWRLIAMQKRNQETLATEDSHGHYEPRVPSLLHRSFQAEDLGEEFLEAPSLPPRLDITNSEEFVLLATG